MIAPATLTSALVAKGMKIVDIAMDPAAAAAAIAGGDDDVGFQKSSTRTWP